MAAEDLSTLKYRSFLVRLWQLPEGRWCARVERVGAREQLMFTNWEDLLAFLQGEVETQTSHLG